MDMIIFFIIAVCSGIVGALVGLGGGIIFVPVTLFLVSSFDFLPELTPQKVVGLSVLMMIFTGLSSTISYNKAKLIDYKSGLIFFIGSVPGTILGAYLNKGLDLPSFNLYFGILMIFLSALLMVRDRLKSIQWFVNHGTKRTFVDKDGKQYEYGYPVWFAIILTFCIGLMSGLFGIGGGSMIVPAMVLLFLFPPHVAVATSMFMVFLSSLINSGSHIALGNVSWIFALPVIIGGYIGAKGGAALNKKLNSKTVVFVLQLVMLITGIRLVIISIL